MVLCIIICFLINQPDAAICSQFYSTARLLYMFRAFYTPIIRGYNFNCIYSLWYKS